MLRIIRYSIFISIVVIYFAFCFYILKEYELKYFIALSLGTLITIFSFLKPDWMLFLCIGSIPFYQLVKIEIGIPTFTIYDTIVMLLFLVFLIQWTLGRTKFKFTYFDFFVFVWIGINLISLFHNLYNPIASINDFRYRFAIPIALYFLIRYYVRDLRTFYTFLYIQVLSISILAFFAIIEFATTGMRVETLIHRTLTAALLFCWAIFLCMFIQKSKNSKITKIISISGLLINIPALFFTFARIIFASLIFLIGLVKCGILKVKKEIFVITFFIFGALFPFLTINIYENYLSKLETPKVYHQEIFPNYAKKNNQPIDKTPKHIVDKDFYKKSIEGRAMNWKVMLEIFKGNFLFGAGFSIFSYLREQGLITIFHAHNICLDIVLRTGIVGLSIFCLLILSYIRFWENVYKNLAGHDRFFLGICLLEIVLILINGLTNNIMGILINSIFWSVISLSFCFIELKNKNA